MSDKIFIVDGIREINAIKWEYSRDLSDWQTTCWNIKNSYVQKTSRVKVNQAGDTKKYMNWYQQIGSGLKSVGKEEPNYESLYPLKPADPISFQFDSINNTHILLTRSDYEIHQDVFRECFAFPFSELIKDGGSSD